MNMTLTAMRMITTSSTKMMRMATETMSTTMTDHYLEAMTMKSPVPGMAPITAMSRWTL